MKVWMNQLNVLEWTNQVPDLNAMDDLKQVVNARKPNKIPGLKLVCEENLENFSKSTGLNSDNHEYMLTISLLQAEFNYFSF